MFITKHLYTIILIFQLTHGHHRDSTLNIRSIKQRNRQYKHVLDEKLKYNNVFFYNLQHFYKMLNLEAYRKLNEILQIPLKAIFLTI